jgi:hypothetical protein
VTWQLLAAAGEDSWWRWISMSSSADFFMEKFVFAYIIFSIGPLLVRESRHCLILLTTFVTVLIVHIVGIVRVHI